MAAAVPVTRAAALVALTLTVTLTLTLTPTVFAVKDALADAARARRKTAQLMGEGEQLESELGQLDAKFADLKRQKQAC